MEQQNRKPDVSPARVLDITATVVLTGVLGLAAALSCYVSIFFLMADPWGAAAAWAGAYAALLIVTVGIVVGAVRRKVMFWWPLVGILVVVATFFAGWQMVLAAAP